jgi:hypothetical protein
MPRGILYCCCVKRGIGFMDFKQRVHNDLIQSARIYKSVFMDYDYLIFSEEFIYENYYVVKAHEDNFAHLTGVNRLISADDFYFRCLNATLNESDFDFKDKVKSEKSVKNTVRRKSIAFLNLPDFFSNVLQAKESFSKGNVHCVVGAANNAISIGFIVPPNLRPMSLLKGNTLNQAKAVNVSLVLRRNRNADRFDTILQGDVTRFLC